MKAKGSRIGAHGFSEVSHERVKERKEVPAPTGTTLALFVPDLYHLQVIGY